MTARPLEPELNGPLHGEEAIIQSYLAPLAAGYPGALGLKDDCAAFAPTPGHDLVVKTDPIAAGIHFLPDDPPEDIAWKALAVNVSDLAAKAAVPRVYLMALSFPEAPTRGWMAAFARGLAEAQAAFGMHLIGGDTDRRPGPVTVSITVLGEVPAGGMVRRGAARAGDLIYVSGTLGDAAAGLALARDAGLALRIGIGGADSAWLKARYRRPMPRLGLREALGQYARAAMDISDGLLKDLGRMCRASGCGAVIELARTPLSTPLLAAKAMDRPWAEVALTAGDDYEVLFTVAPEAAAALETAARASGIGVTQIGRMDDGAAVRIDGPDGQPLSFGRAGWDHF